MVTTYRSSEKQGVNSRVAESFDKGRQEVGERCHGLHAHLIKNAKPHSIVFGGHLKCCQGFNLCLFMAGVFD